MRSVGVKLRCDAIAAVACVLSVTVMLSGAAQATRSPPGGHSIPGGINGVVRANYTVTATGSVSGIGTIALPQPNTVFLLPLNVTNFAESSDFTLEHEGTVLINTTGFYRLALCVDWPGQHGVDTDLRYYGIGRLRAKQTLSGKMVGGLYDINTSSYDELAVTDIPGSDVPLYSRTQVNWAPGTIAAGSYATMDVKLPQTGIVAPGDFVQVNDTALTDHIMQSTSNNDAISVSGKVVEPDTVRIYVDNLRGGKAVTVPSGTFNIVAGSATSTAGNSADAWDVIQSPTVLLYAGERVFAKLKSKTPGDFIQVSNQTYFQVELVNKEP